MQVFFPETRSQRLEVVGFEEVTAQQMEWTGGIDVGEDVGDCSEDLVLEVVEGVEDDGFGFEAVTGFGTQEIEHDVVCVLGSDEAGNVL